MFRKLINKLFKFNKQLISKIEWQNEYTDLLLDWSSRGIQGNKKDILVRRIFCYGIFLAGIIFTLFCLAVGAKSFKDIGVILGTQLFVFGPIFFMIYFIMIGKFYIYQITAETIELVSWKDEIPKFKEMVQIMFWLIGIFLLIVLVVDPSALLVGLGGMGVIGIIAGVTLYSKGFTERYLEYQHLLTTWDKVSKIEITEPLGLVYIWGDNLKDKEQTRDLFYLFYTPENKEQLIELVKQKAQQHNLTIVYSDE